MMYFTTRAPSLDLVLAVCLHLYFENDFRLKSKVLIASKVVGPPIVIINQKKGEYFGSCSKLSKRCQSILFMGA